MTGKIHEYAAHLRWTGNAGDGTSRYDAYERGFRVEIAQKPTLEGSADPAFRGDPRLHNPEDLFVAAVSSCHMLTYLALCARQGVRVVAYEDQAEGKLEVSASGDGCFSEVRLRPEVTVASDGDVSLALSLHQAAHECCFIANSCSVPIRCEPNITVSVDAGAMP